VTLAGPTKLIGNSPPYTVPEMLKAYQGSIADGTGQTIAIVIDTFPANSDLTEFWNANSIGQSLNNIQKVQVVTGTLPSPSGEETLDVEWSSGIAPGAKVRVYATTDLSFGHLDQAYQAIINDLPAQPNLHEVSLSYGLGETYMSTGQMQTDDQYFASLAAAGVTVFVSSGDGGSSSGLSGYGDTSGPVQVESPADDPNVMAVGGTSLLLNTSTGAVSNESAWSLGGGGSSQFFSRPVWQVGTGVPTGAFRLVPDVALVADPNTGGYLILNGQVYIVGGTSWSAPSWAGICARINQTRANAASPPIGLLGPKIYPLLGSSNLRDITAGSNGSKGAYNAGQGFDLLIFAQGSVSR
jgi:kumamolisin